jgi:hypothetical protein
MKKPIGVKCWYVGAATCRNDDGCLSIGYRTIFQLYLCLLQLYHIGCFSGFNLQK